MFLQNTHCFLSRNEKVLKSFKLQDVANERVFLNDRRTKCLQFQQPSLCLLRKSFSFFNLSSDVSRISEAAGVERRRPLTGVPTIIP